MSHIQSKVFLFLASSATAVALGCLGTQGATADEEPEPSPPEAVETAPPAPPEPEPSPFGDCGKAPAGMLCVPGGGPDKIKTFYIDSVASEDKDACEEARICRSRDGSWAWAREYCTWQGKRLPTSFELQLAITAGKVTAPEEPVWTSTWEGDDPAPHGTCTGAPRCKESDDRLRSDGKGASPSRTLGPVLCASSNEWLATYPPMDRADEPAPPLPSPDPERAKIAWDLDVDNLKKKGICGKSVRQHWGENLQNGGRSTTRCRDPYSYVRSNEPRRHIWVKHFANLGGGYVGVGSDQSYDFISIARSEWAWVFDYDPNVVRLHRILRPLIKAAETREALVALFDRDNKEKAIELIVASEEDEDQSKMLRRFYEGWRYRLDTHYRRSLRPSTTRGHFGWLAHDDHYQWIRTLILQDRLVPVPADMLGKKSFQAMGAAAKKMEVPIRVYYTSNAPTAWGGQITDDYRANVLALPMDEQSVVLGTFNTGAFGQRGYWHYNVMNGLLFQERMALAGYTSSHVTRGPIWDRIPGDDRDLTLCGLRGKSD